MCYSAEADLVTGIVVGGAGIDALRHVRHRREIALAVLPVVFGAHQAVETMVWWGLDGHVPAGLGEAAMWVYLVVAFLLPAIVPLAIRSIEPDPLRRRMVVPFAVLGTIVTVILLVELLSGPVAARVAGRYIEYGVTLEYGGQVTALYVIATCVPLLLSSRGTIVVFGILNLTAVAVLAWLLATGVISLWCAWAAVTSIVIVIHLRTAETNRSPAAG
jgi:hypothetical protein